MKTKNSLYILLFIFISLGISCDNNNLVQNTSPNGVNQENDVKAKASNIQNIPNQYIVILKEQWQGQMNASTASQVRAFVNQKISNFNIPQEDLKSTYDYALRGFTAELSAPN